MSRRARLLLFAGGSALFAYLISRIGLAALIADAAETGWMFLPILLLYGFVYACNAAAWRLILAGEPRRPSFWRLYAVTASGFALNFVTPMVNVGGEPFKIAAVAPWVSTRRAAGSVLIHNVLRGSTTCRCAAGSPARSSRGASCWPRWMRRWRSSISGIPVASPVRSPSNT